MLSPAFMPVPANSQWSGFWQVQSPPPFTGSTLRAPISNPSSGPWCGKGPFFFSRLTAYSCSAPYGPPRKMIRFGRPSLLSRYGVTQQTELPERNNTFTPASRSRSTLRNCARFQYSS